MGETNEKESESPKVEQPERKKHAGGRPPIGALFKPEEVLERADGLEQEELIKEVPLIYLKTLYIALETAKSSMRGSTWQDRFKIAQRTIDSLLDDKAVKSMVLLSNIRPEANPAKKAKKETGPAEPVKTTWKDSPKKDEETKK